VSIAANSSGNFLFTFAPKFIGLAHH
jgi:hypothetical protein